MSRTEELACGFESHDEYALYFNHLCHVFSRLISCYPAGREKNYEMHSIRSFLVKLLYSVQALRKKHTYNPAHTLKIDLTDSGFPHFLEFSYFEVDLLNRKDQLIALPPTPMLKQSILDYIFAHQADPKELLWQLSRREYYQLLEADKLFLTFTPGICELQSEGNGVRSYIFSWACFDFKSNRPYIHIMTFDQDISGDPLEWKGANYHQFLEVIKSEGSRVPEVGVLALAIDDCLEAIHPKVLKRICIGPLHSDMTCSLDDELCRMLGEHSSEPDDFILLMKHEIVFSERQTTLQAGYLTPARVREIFYLPETDLECYEAKASTIHRYMLLPHRVLQQVEADPLFQKYEQHRKLTFDAEGQVHGIQ